MAPRSGGAARRRAQRAVVHYHLGRIIREKLAGCTDERDRPILDLTWDYPTNGALAEPDAEAVLAEINGWDAEGKPLSAYTGAEGRRVDRLRLLDLLRRYADGVNQAARRKPGTRAALGRAEWGWAWPMNRRTLYNRASADPDGKPWSDRKAYVWWDEEDGKWTGHDVPDFQADKRPDYRPPEGARAEDAIAGDEPFIMQTDGKAWLFVPTGLVDGPLPTHYEPQESPFANALYRQQNNPARQVEPPTSATGTARSATSRAATSFPLSSRPTG